MPEPDFSHAIWWVKTQLKPLGKNVKIGGWVHGCEKPPQNGIAIGYATHGHFLETSHWEPFDSTSFRRLMSTTFEVVPSFKIPSQIGHRVQVVVPVGFTVGLSNNKSQQQILKSWTLQTHFQAIVTSIVTLGESESNFCVYLLGIQRWMPYILRTRREEGKLRKKKHLMVCGWFCNGQPPIPKDRSARPSCPEAPAAGLPSSVTREQKEAPQVLLGQPFVSQWSTHDHANHLEGGYPQPFMVGRSSLTNLPSPGF